MSITWIEPLKLVKKRMKWVGQVEFQDSAVEVVCQCFDKSKGARNGDAPQPRLAKKVDRMVLKAMDNHDRDMSTIAPAFADLYNQHWKPSRGRNLSSDNLKQDLKLAEILLAQGVTRDQYTVIFSDPHDRFRSYIPQSEIDEGKINSILVQTPRDSKGEALLPYLGAMQFAELPAEESAQQVSKKVPLTDRVAKVKWAEPLSYNKKSKQWCGQVVVRRKEIKIEVEAPQTGSPPPWIEERLGKILACVVVATGVVAEQVAVLYNDDWREGRKFSVSKVKRCIQLESIDFVRKDDWRMTFADGDLFAGHWIVASVNSSGEVDFDLWG